MNCYSSCSLGLSKQDLACKSSAYSALLRETCLICSPPFRVCGIRTGSAVQVPLCLLVTDLSWTLSGVRLLAPSSWDVL